MKQPIKLHDHYEFTSVQRTYDIVDQFCTARVTIYAMVDSNNAVDITDSEVSFLLNDKPCKYDGFKDLYISLYGLRCNNGKEIDMTHYVLKQIQGEITREELQERINYYKTTNK